MQKEFKKALCFDDVLLVPNHSNVMSRSDVKLAQVLYGRNYNLKLEIPLIGAPMDTVMGVDMAITLSKMGGLGIIHRYNSIDDQADMVSKVYAANSQCGVAIPGSKDYLERFNACFNAGARVFCIDMAHGDHVLMHEALTKLKKLNMPVYLIAGNVTHSWAAGQLAKAGADCVRISVGGGSVCTTRIVTGFGVPTLHAVMEMADWMRRNCPEVAILADGGIKNSGDAVKSLVAGAHLVMCGNLLAGTDEAPGQLSIDLLGNKTKAYRGMASFGAMKSLDPNKKVTPEGIAHQIPYKGSVVDVVNDFIGGIRSGCSYAGVDDIANLYNSADFIEISQAGYRESLPHATTKY